MKKEVYEELYMEVIVFEGEDIITESPLASRNAADYGLDLMG